MGTEWGVDGSTRVVALIGDPVAHSLSPALHNAAFRATGLNWVYVALAVRADQVADALRGAAALGLAGFNVTVPHKQSVAGLVDELRGAAARAGAVNTVVFEGGRSVGYNTDIDGFRQALHAARPEGVAGERVLLLGAGGAARAAALALADEPVAALTVADRTPERAREVATLVAHASPAVSVSSVALKDLDAEQVRRARLVVNATVLGMTGKGKVPAVLADNVGVDQIVYDVVYGSRPTELIQAARVRGALTVDGVEMLVWQAAIAFELWTGVQAPVQAMRDAIRAR